MIQALLDYQTADAKLKKIEKTLAESEERKKAVSAKKYLEKVASSNPSLYIVKEANRLLAEIK